MSVQNQTGNHARKWYKSGEVLDMLPHNQYRIRMDGSHRISLRNRQFLCKISLFINKQTEIIRDSSMGKGLVCAPNKMPDTPVHVAVGDTVTPQPQENQNDEHPKEVPL